MTWCTFETGYAGICGKFVKGVGSSRCDRHLGKKETPKRSKGTKFRGDSKFSVREGLWTSK